MKLRVSLLVLFAFASLLAEFAGSVLAQEDLGHLVIDGENPWPEQHPFPAARAAEIVFCQTEVGEWDPEGTSRWFLVDTQERFQEMVDACLTGAVWFKTDFRPWVTVENPALPEGFCENSDGYVVNWSNPWPTDDPCSEETQHEMLVCEFAIGQFDPPGKVRIFADFEESRETCLSGVWWARPKPKLVFVPLIVR